MAFKIYNELDALRAHLVLGTVLHGLHISSNPD